MAAARLEMSNLCRQVTSRTCSPGGAWWPARRPAWAAANPRLRSTASTPPPTGSGFARRPGAGRALAPGAPGPGSAAACTDRAGAAARTEVALPRVSGVEARILTAVAAARLRHTAAALDAFTDAVAPRPTRGHDTAVRETAVESISDLLHPTPARRVRASRFHPASLTAITQASDRQPPARAAAASVEHLTDRELLVLRYLPTMLKAAEIAADLYLSVHTGKTHLRSIYRKLDVTTRKDAVDRARAMNLI